MRRIASALAAASLPALAACSIASIDGEVDGDVVPAFRTGIVYEAPALTADDDYIAVAAFYTFSNGCASVAEHYDVKADGLSRLGRTDAERLVDDVRSFEGDNFPEDYWAAYVAIAGKNEASIEDELEVEEDPVSVIVCHHTGAVDSPREELQAPLLPDYVTPFARDSNRDCFVADGGDVRVSLYDKKSISLVAEVSLVDDQDDDAGKIELGGVAARCEAVEDAADGLLEELEDFVAESNASSSSDNSCRFAFDGVCDEPDDCAPGTDTADCRS